MIEKDFLEIERCRDILDPFQTRWKDLASEADAISEAEWIQHPDSYYAPSGWFLTSVRFFGRDNPDALASAPLLAELLSHDARIINAAYLRLNPRSEIAPHRGRPVGLGRFHLGLKVPEGCSLQVGTTCQPWVEGDWLAFDDSCVHSAWNHAEVDRIVLQLDIEHPAIKLPKRAYAVRFLSGVYYDILRRHHLARRGVAWFNQVVRNGLRPLEKPR